MSRARWFQSGKQVAATGQDADPRKRERPATVNVMPADRLVLPSRCSLFFPRLGHGDTLLEIRIAN
jgi:hypothetical protein